MLNTIVHTNMIAIWVGVPNWTATRKAMPVDMKPPMYGMKARMNDSTAIGTTKEAPG